ncbi:class I SAM-dependent methyltransferase [Pseudonocardia spinosispora]|uniref:class I SAM-dependent methyltransferase n=1 Tax=Pseudonocardia spinosispora TaxID=103441 RepID=UPI0004908F23|nr:methyltransferase domain-containing protein [Pseudonocardia spinosispora]
MSHDADTPEESTPFDGPIPEFYEQHLVPLIFATYADDLASRIAGYRGAILETAAGTGVLTRRLVQTLDPSATLFATDISDSMLRRAQDMGTDRPVTWAAADAMALPFPDSSFDVVVCQFGIMFMRDRVRALAEARRVLRRDGVLLFNTWDRIEENEFVGVVSDAVAALFPADPPTFINRVPHGYHDPHAIRDDVRAAGFTRSLRVISVQALSHAASARSVAVACCCGTPLLTEIETRDRSKVDEAIESASRAIEDRFGQGPISGRLSAWIVSARK